MCRVSVMWSGTAIQSSPRDLRGAVKNINKTLLLLIHSNCTSSDQVRNNCFWDGFFGSFDEAKSYSNGPVGQRFHSKDQVVCLVFSRKHIIFFHWITIGSAG